MCSMPGLSLETMSENGLPTRITQADTIRDTSGSVNTKRSVEISLHPINTYILKVILSTTMTIPMAVFSGIIG